jgi:hypothetical protein
MPVNHTHAADSEWIASRAVGLVTADPSIRPKTMAAVLTDNNITRPRYHTVLRGLHQAKHRVHGDESKGFAASKDYLSKFCNDNPGSHVAFDQEGDVYKRLFVCPAAMINAMRYCRKVYALDGTHVKSTFKGVLLYAVTHDANNKLLLLAFAHVSVENEDNWAWFLRETVSAATITW